LQASEGVGSPVLQDNLPHEFWTVDIAAVFPLVVTVGTWLHECPTGPGLRKELVAWPWSLGVYGKC
jgi:hypothetical protein